MTTFTEKFKIKALEDRLPFGLDFEIKQVKSSLTASVIGLDLPVLNDITSAESWFFESLEFQNAARTQELTLSLRTLAKKLQFACSLKSLSEASSALFEPSDTLLETEEYDKFLDENYLEIDRIKNVCRLIQDPVTINWLRVTFFMLSRYSADWSLSDTAMLTSECLNELLAFITKEVNKGVEVTKPLESESDNETSEELEGERVLEPVGQKSTGS